MTAAEVQQAIVRTLRASPGDTVEQVGVKTQIAQGPLWRAFGRLTEDGTLVRLGRGWQLNPKWPTGHGS